jgi:hypothetical protein
MSDENCTCSKEIDKPFVCVCSASFIKCLEKTVDITNNTYHNLHQSKNNYLTYELSDILSKLEILYKETIQFINRITNTTSSLNTKIISYFVNIGKTIIKNMNNIKIDLYFCNLRIKLLSYTNKDINQIEFLYDLCVLQYKKCNYNIRFLYTYKILNRRIKIKKVKISKKILETIYEHTIVNYHEQ